MNEPLEDKILEDKLCSTLFYMKKGKISRPNGFSVEFFLGFYEILKYYLLKVVQESKKNGYCLGVINSMFLSLNPKK